MHPLFHRGFAIETLALLALGAAGALGGWLIAPGLLGAVAEGLSLGAVFLTSPSDALVIRLKLAIALALPSGVVWVALLVHRLRAGEAPTRARLLAIAATPWVAAGVAGAARLAAVSLTLRTSGTYDVEPMIAAVELAPGTWAMRATLAVGVLLWVVVALRARPAGSLTASGGGPSPASRAADRG